MLLKVKARRYQKFTSHLEVPMPHSLFIPSPTHSSWSSSSPFASLLMLFSDPVSSLLLFPPLNPYPWTPTLLRVFFNYWMCILSLVEAGVSTTGCGSNEIMQVKGQNFTLGKLNGNIIKWRETMRSRESPGRSQGRSSHPHFEWVGQPRKNTQLGNPNYGITGGFSKKGSEQARACQEMGSVMVWMFASLQNSYVVIS